MKTTNFKMLSKNQQEQVLGGKLPGGTHGTVVGWSCINGVYYADIQYEGGGDVSCGVYWGTTMPQIGEFAG